ncbi:hypothetical protein L1887_40795 [Cichorium endivia]|nr:hypothetical protein L1887_40795 [Cichorium endivia]
MNHIRRSLYKYENTRSWFTGFRVSYRLISVMDINPVLWISTLLSLSLLAPLLFRDVSMWIEGKRVHECWITS